jgi:hypothetical protein
MKKATVLLFSVSVFGCAPAYVIPENSKVATINIEHQGPNPSSTSINIFSNPKCEKEFYLGELASVGTSIDLKKSATKDIEANKIIYFSGTRHWKDRYTALDIWCSRMFSFTPKEGAAYNIKIIGTELGTCATEVVEEKSKKAPIDFKELQVDRVCSGVDVHYSE